LILEKEPYEYRRAMSDISGVDIKAHRNEPARLVRAVHNWFVETVGVRKTESPTKVWYRFTDFTSAFYDTRKEAGYSVDDLEMMPVPEYIDFMRDWIADLRARPRS
jgi:hypothetical protein